MTLTEAINILNINKHRDEDTWHSSYSVPLRGLDVVVNFKARTGYYVEIYRLTAFEAIAIAEKYLQEALAKSINFDQSTTTSALLEIRIR